jgi:choline dehydrogenase-like flavoprotein
MIRALDDLAPESSLDATVCIVGAGAAGITLACELDGGGFSVLLLEAGGLQQDVGLSDELYRGTASPPHPNPSEFRRVVFGGTTTIWGGRCAPFDPIDFEAREYISRSGWPISYAELARFYPRALEYCDAGRCDFTVDGSLPEARRRVPTLPGLDQESALETRRLERYSLPSDFGQRRRATIAASANVTALLHARCVGLHRAPGDGRIECLTVVDRADRRRRVRAQVVVLAMGGIEVPRLLLASDAAGPGIGNRNDLLGRFYACHFENILARLVAPKGTIPFAFEKSLDRVYCRRKLQFSSEAQREHRLLNTAFRLHFPPYSDAAHGSAALSAIYLAKSMLIPEYRVILQHGSEPAVRSTTLEHIRNVALGVPELGRFAWKWLFLRTLAERKLPYTLVPNRDGSYPLEFDCEQTPAESNRITLLEETDRQGMRRVHVQWRVSAEDADATHRAFRLLRSLLQQHSLCRLEFEESALRESIGRSPPLGGHHLGTTRMAATPRAGVVNENCALFESPNLYVASSAVFCTASHANPTLTIVAFALRLAEHLKARLGGQPTLTAAESSVLP